MISKQIQAHKERQELRLKNFYSEETSSKDKDMLFNVMIIHKQDLILFKEYLEKRLEFLQKEVYEKNFYDTGTYLINQLKEEIKELNKMIEAYE